MRSFIKEVKSHIFAPPCNILYIREDHMMVSKSQNIYFVWCWTIPNRAQIDNCLNFIRYYSSYELSRQKHNTMTYIKFPDRHILMDYDEKSSKTWCPSPLPSELKNVNCFNVLISDTSLSWYSFLCIFGLFSISIFVYSFICLIAPFGNQHLVRYNNNYYY
jgi:hypothetical protein